MADICNVCADSFNKTVRKPVSCNKCDFDACLACYKRFLCDNTADPGCMSCKTSWNYETMTEMFPKKFVTTTLKEHRRNQLFERELSLMPATQPYVEQRLERNRLDAAVHACKQEIKRLNHRYRELVMEHGNRRVPEKAEIKDAVSTLHERIRDMYINTITTNISIEDTKQPKMTRHCPAADCRGFLSTKWKCGLCNSKVCKECHEILDPNNNGKHECKPEDVETAKLLMRDSKPCPGCAVLIFKISGCNQMWCCNCGTAFDWATLRIDRGHIHNPEYFRALHAGRLPFAQRENNNADICGQNMPPDYQLISHLNSIRELPNPIRVDLTEYYRKMRHFQLVLRPRYARNIMDENRDLRISYMMKEIDVDLFKRRLQLREKASNKCIAIVQVLDMLNMVAIGLFHDMLLRREVTFHTAKQEELRELINYGQECLAKVSKAYDCEVPLLVAERR